MLIFGVCFSYCCSTRNFLLLALMPQSKSSLAKLSVLQQLRKIFKYVYWIERMVKPADESGCGFSLKVQPWNLTCISKLIKFAAQFHGVCYWIKRKSEKPQLRPKSVYEFLPFGGIKSQFEFLTSETLYLDMTLAL